MRLLRRPRLSLLLGAAVLFALQAAFATTLTPNAVPAGGEFVLGGIAQSDFAPRKKPKVELVPAAGTTEPGITTVKARVLEFAADSIRLRADKGIAGVYTVRVTPAEKTTVFSADGLFLIAAPVPTTLEPSSAAPKSPLVIRGSLFGGAKGSVTIGGRKAAVKAWGADAVGVIVPKLEPGTYPVVVTSGAGPSVAELTFRVLATLQRGDEYLRADIAGHGRVDIDLREPLKFAVTWDQFHTLGITGAQGRKASFPILALAIGPFQPERAAPYSVGLVPELPIQTIAVTTFTQSQTVFHIASGGSAGSELTVDVTSWDGEFLVGGFHGTLVDGLGGGAAPIEVTNGEFRVRPGEAP